MITGSSRFSCLHRESRLSDIIEKKALFQVKALAVGAGLGIAGRAIAADIVSAHAVGAGQASSAFGAGDFF